MTVRYTTLHYNTPRYTTLQYTTLRRTTRHTAVRSEHIACDYIHFDKTSCAIELHVGVASVQDTDKFVDQHLDSHSRGVSFNDATRNFTKFPVLLLGVFFCGIQQF